MFPLTVLLPEEERITPTATPGSVFPVTVLELAETKRMATPKPPDTMFERIVFPEPYATAIPVYTSLMCWFSTIMFEQLTRITCPAPPGIVPPEVFLQ